MLPLAHAGHDVGGEVVDLSLAALDERRNQVAADVVARGLVGSVDRDRVDEHVRAEHVVAHRGEDLVWRVGEPDGVAGLLAERADRAAVVSGLDHAELACLLDRDPDAGHGHSRSGLDVLVHHLARVHAVDVVGTEHADVVGALVVEQIEVLVDRVGRAGEPVRAVAHLRRHSGDVVSEQRRETPRRRDVPVERVALVLGQHDDLQVPGVDEVREREVDQAVVAPERHGRLRAIGGQRRQPFPLAPGEHESEDQRRRHATSGELRPEAD